MENPQKYGLEKQGKDNMGISEATKKKLEDNLNKALEKETPESWNKFLDGGEQNPAWSEEDEEMRLDAIKYLEIFDAQGIHGDRTIPAINWLKSLRPQNTWKPNEEHMLAIDTAINVLGKGTLNGKQLIELQEQLKKLK